MRRKKSSSWDPVSKWYDQIVGEKGHTYHKEVIFPCLQSYLDFDSSRDLALLDLGCGNGVLERYIPKNVGYLGVDIAPNLLKIAEEKRKSPNHHFQQADITKPIDFSKKFTHAVALLSLQNLKEPQKALELASNHLHPGGQFIAVLNHPCFRIPRQSSWGTDKEKNIQYRRVDRYLSPMEIPIYMNPSKGEQSKTTISTHAPLSHWIKWLAKCKFVVTDLEELCSNKTSEGGAAKRENIARNEFPLFLVIKARKGQYHA